MKSVLSRAVLLTLMIAPACWAGPREDVAAALAKSYAASSWRASMTATSPRPMSSELHFVAPDRYRMRMAGVGEQTIIGNTMYMTLQGRTMKLPVPKAVMDQWNALARIGQKPLEMDVTALGSDRVAGAPARKYRVRYIKPQPGEMTLWIGTDGYPLQILTGGGGNGTNATTIRYSRFNDPAIRVAAP